MPGPVDFMLENRDLLLAAGLWTSGILLFTGIAVNRVHRYFEQRDTSGLTKELKKAEDDKPKKADADSTFDEWKKGNR